MHFPTKFFNRTAFILIFGVIFAQSCDTNKKTKPMKDLIPPTADQKPHQHKIHNDIRMDEYFWLKERENPEVIDYLERENDFYAKSTAHTVDFQNDLFEEMKARIKEDDSSVPYFYNGYWYISRYEKGQEYPIHTRKKGSIDAEEEILFDCNQMAEGHDYFKLVGINISPDNTKVIYGLDLESRRKYTLHVKDLITDIDIVKGTTNDPRYREAVDIYNKVKSKYPNLNIIATGHSLGGNLALYLNSLYGIQSESFNAGLGLGFIKSNPNRDKAILHIIKGDPISSLGALSNLGKVRVYNAVTDNPHSMQNYITQ